MTIRRVAAVTRQEFLFLGRDPVPIVLTIGMPLLILPFVEPVLKVALRSGGSSGATGAEQAVPGLGILFAFFLLSYVGDIFFREHGWNTWDRLRLTRLSRLDIMFGKALPAFAVVVLQMSGLLALGAAFFGLRIRGSLLGVAVVVLAFGLAVIGFALLLVSLCRTTQRLDMIATLGAMACSGLGGALTPLRWLPSFARPLAPLTPSYWAMRGFRSVLLARSGIGSVALPAVVLISMAVVATSLTAIRFRFDERKATWT